MRLSGVFILILAFMVVTPSRAEILVIVNASNPIQQMTKRQLVEMYMGRNIYFADGNKAIRLDQKPDTKERQQFYQRLVNKNVAQVNAYWARLLFTGRTKPPKTENSTASLLETIRANPHAIGYIHSEHYNQDHRIKVIAQLQ